MARTSLWRLTAVLLSCAGLLLLGAAAASAQGSPADQPPGLDSLWSEYPLNPETTEAPPREPPLPPPEPPRSEQPSDAGASPAPAGKPAEDSGGGSSPWRYVRFSVLAGVTALMVLIIVVLADRAALIQGFSAHPPVRPRQGGANMTDAFRRIRGRGDPRKQPDSSSSWREFATPESRPPADPLEFYTGKRSTAVDSESQEPTPQDELDDASEGEPLPATAAQVGEHVTAVIASAQQAAEQIRREAGAETERLRAEARDEIEARMAESTREAEKVRADAGAYSRKTRQDADAYAGETRSEAESFASRLRAEAEESAREMFESTTQEAKRIEAQARRRGEAMVAEAERCEERLKSLHTVFQGITSQLEAVLARDSETTPDGESRQAALTDVIPPTASKQVSP